MARSYYHRSYTIIGFAALTALVISLAPAFLAVVGHPLDYVSHAFRLIDVVPAAIHEIVSAVIDGSSHVDRSSMFMFVAASCLTLFGLFAFAARSEVRGAPGSIAIGV